MSNNESALIIENAEITYLNFAGREGMYNREGDRNFCVFIDPAVAEEMMNDGWNVKFTKIREEGDVPRPYIQVSVGFKFRPPRIALIATRDGEKVKTFLEEEQVEILDWVEIANVDLSIRPRPWEIGGKKGIKAYLRSLFVTLHEDELDQKYADVRMAGNELSAPTKPLELESGDTPPWDGYNDEGDIVEAELVD